MHIWFTLKSKFNLKVLNEIQKNQIQKVINIKAFELKHRISESKKISENSGESQNEIHIKTNDKNSIIINHGSDIGTGNGSGSHHNNISRFGSFNKSSAFEWFSKIIFMK